MKTRTSVMLWILQWRGLITEQPNSFMIAVCSLRKLIGTGPNVTENTILSYFLRVWRTGSKTYHIRNFSSKWKRLEKSGLPRTWWLTGGSHGGIGAGAKWTSRTHPWFHEKIYQRICNLRIQSEAKSSTTWTVSIQECRNKFRIGTVYHSKLRCRMRLLPIQRKTKEFLSRIRLIRLKRRKKFLSKINTKWNTTASAWEARITQMSYIHSRILLVHCKLRLQLPKIKKVLKSLTRMKIRMKMRTRIQIPWNEKKIILMDPVV